MNHHKIEIVDIEEFAKHGKKVPPSGVIYFIKIDGHKYEVPTPTITGKELLELAGKTPIEKFDLYQKFSGGKREKIEPQDVVDLTTFGVEKFVAICKTNTDGLYGGKRDFPLPFVDQEFLDSTGLKWETISAFGQKRVIIYKYLIPDGYKVKEVDIALVIVSSYPESQIDMAFFRPALQRADGIAIKSISEVKVGEESWQQWSRHRPAEVPWRPGIDDLSSHMAYVEHWLKAELKRG